MSDTFPVWAAVTIISCFSIIMVAVTLMVVVFAFHVLREMWRDW